MTAPYIGDRVKYVGTALALPWGLIEDPKIIGRIGTVVSLHDADGDPVPSIPGSWPIQVEWDDDSPSQTCFKNEVVKLDEPA